MASHATFRFYHQMLKGKGPSFVSMAIEAELVLRVGGAQLVRQESAMGIMAVGACNQSFIYAVMKGLGELRLNIKMAGIAKLRLRGPQQPRFDFGSVNRMAIDASDIILQMF